MRAGRLRHKVEIQQATESQDSTGAIVETWATFLTLRASYEPKTAKESYQSSQEFAQSSAMFRTRYRSGVTTKMRLLFDNRLFDIEGVVDMYGRGREMQILCTENV
ncbi:MAG: SPP1 family predicted phage head-tail adaptor [Cycloclasticus pugetii]|jgi:SPP1 family predicted phage head-tail adaptor